VGWPNNDPDLSPNREEARDGGSSPEPDGGNAESEPKRVPRETEPILVVGDPVGDGCVVATTVSALAVEHQRTVDTTGDTVGAELDIHTRSPVGIIVVIQT
jgi:hypothetical protein